MNPYLILGSADRELAFTRALAYWINPLQSHDLGDASGREFLRMVERTGQRPVDGRVVPRNWRGGLAGDCVRLVQTELRLGRKEQLDMVLTTGSARIFVEVKLWAPEGDRQIERYVETVKSFVDEAHHDAIVVFVTPGGRAPISISGPDADQVIRVSFDDLEEWLATLLGMQLNQDQVIGLTQFRDWIRHVLNYAGATVAPFDEHGLKSFWLDVRDRLVAYLVTNTRLSRWKVAFSDGYRMVADGSPNFVENYSKLGFFIPEDGPHKYPMVVFEGIEGKANAGGAFYGVRDPFDWLVRAGSDHERVELIAALAARHFQKDRWYFGRKYFAANGWPSFQPGDGYTDSVLKKPASRSEIVKQMAKELCALLDKYGKTLEAIPYLPK